MKTADLSWFLLIFAFALPAGPGAAQSKFVVSPGDSVRVWSTHAGENIQGRVISVHASSLTLAVEGAGQPLVVERDRLSRLQVRGYRRPWLKGALLGAAIGGGALALAGFADGDDECPPQDWCLIQFSAEEKAAVGLAFGGVLGGVTGMVIGALTRTPTWREVSLQGVGVAGSLTPAGRARLEVRVPMR